MEWFNTREAISNAIVRICKETPLDITVEDYPKVYEILEKLTDDVYSWGYDNGAGRYDI